MGDRHSICSKWLAGYLAKWADRLSGTRTTQCDRYLRESAVDVSESYGGGDGGKWRLAAAGRRRFQFGRCARAGWHAIWRHRQFAIRRGGTGPKIEMGISDPLRKQGRTRRGNGRDGLLRRRRWNFVLLRSDGE